MTSTQAIQEVIKHATRIKIASGESLFFTSVEKGALLQHEVQAKLGSLQVVLQHVFSAISTKEPILHPFYPAGIYSNACFTHEARSNVDKTVRAAEKALRQLEKRLDKPENDKWSFLPWVSDRRPLEEEMQRLTLLEEAFKSILRENLKIIEDRLSVVEEQQRDYILQVIKFVWEVPELEPPVLTEETCQGAMRRFMSSSEYQSWSKGREPRLLWCYGGTGKTVISMEVIRELTERTQTDSHQYRLVLSYFRKSSPEWRQSTDDIIRHFARQLLLNKSLTSSQLSALGVISRQCPRRLPYEELLPVLIRICDPSTTFVVVDGPEGARDMPVLMAALGQLADAGWHILTVSGHRWPSTPPPDNLSDRQIMVCPSIDDIRTYVVHRLSLGNCRYDVDPTDPVIIEIAHAKALNFTLARLATSSLLESADRGGTESQEPHNLKLQWESMILQRAFGKLCAAFFDNRLWMLLPGREAVFRFIAYIAHAARPLRVQELRHALAFNVTRKAVIEYRLFCLEDMLWHCQGVVVHDREYDTLGLFHESAYAFFQSYSKTAHAHEDIAKTSMSYLLSASPSSPCDRGQLQDLHDKAPFLSYAARYWGWHAQKAEENILEEVKAFVLDQGSLFPGLQILKSGQWINPRYRSDDTLNPLHQVTGQKPVHIAAYWGLDLTLRALLLLKEVDAQAKDSDGWTPLHHLTAAVDAKDSGGVTPLELAEFHGHTEVAAMLKKHSAEPQDSVKNLSRENLKTAWLARHTIPDDLQGRAGRVTECVSGV
ncbi:hypothetical protein NMY22_g1233 [Coprinellus aureogranulatus]|nr:hypothetical protein NMY22_g1233 [Coprinellus aureogranulatus]